MKYLDFVCFAIFLSFLTVLIVGAMVVLAYAITGSILGTIALILGLASFILIMIRAVYYMEDLT